MDVPFRLIVVQKADEPSLRQVPAIRGTWSRQLVRRLFSS